MYQYKNRVSYSQLDARGTLGISQVLDVMQDACMFHCQEVGRSCMDLRKEGFAWLVNTWHLQFFRLPEMGDEYNVMTWPYRIKGVFNQQNVVLKSPEGEIHACGDSRWFFYDHENKKPMIIPPEEKAYFREEPGLEMPKMPRKLICPEDTKLVQTVVVCENYIDTNNHVNNGQYVRLAVNVLPPGFEVAEMCAEFRNAAHLEDTMYIRRAVSDNGAKVSIVFTNQEGTPYFLSEFLRK